MKWQPKDIVAMIIAIGAIYLLATGINGRIGTTLLVLTATYYGIDLTPWVKLGRRQKSKKEDKVT